MLHGPLLPAHRGRAYSPVSPYFSRGGLGFVLFRGEPN
ncbi:hypothetical protein CENDO_00565 [Corynebacterium endometrii]|uniref:Uncharacterized protein n=1 Tax=Corynebacterium endometrii TaxID=2488819 RepID=A0A4P7QDH8_9CORY|nr:hypothetical protein CENDO_00565 [Corynebacterium endometrii]